MFPAEETYVWGLDVKLQPIPSITKSTNKTNLRFSDEQIRSLESTFERQSRPELQVKQHLANQLGLELRQIAIWFQNKRARSRSKQIELDYNTLKTNYVTLASKFESVKNENQSLLIQLQRLRNLRWLSKKGRGSNEEFQNPNAALVTEENPSFQLKAYKSRTGIPFCDDNSKNDGDFGAETDFLNMPEPAQGSLTPNENASSFEHGSALENSCRGSEWWEFLS